MYFFGIFVNICLLVLPLAVTIGTLAGIDAHRKALDEEPLFKKGSYFKRAYIDQASSNSTSPDLTPHYDLATEDDISWKATIQVSA
ncbi:hypothetical protein N7462_003153 [Penicillium macrosclerotiorum]|uniref:uncharacterized protein n=1 Tax=Penicillium macrosclerotiorum TaxID=303699 RepID=UPI002546D351|nr:uncharacterized protein N7462_003153 [Penicillium macrosclerotiorum]KAJ5688761.1 hypothetical protein N7462_003153 [Penicillium macrosclerotiorum]